MTKVRICLIKASFRLVAGLPRHFALLRAYQKKVVHSQPTCAFFKPIVQLPNLREANEIVAENLLNLLNLPFGYNHGFGKIWSDTAALVYLSICENKLVTLVTTQHNYKADCHLRAQSMSEEIINTCWLLTHTRPQQRTPTRHHLFPP